MCTTCGCGGDGHQLTAFKPAERPAAFSGLQLATDALPTPPPVGEATETHARKTLVDLEHDILDFNNQQADLNRSRFFERNILAINLVSSPGSGKTSLLERTLADRTGDVAFYVIEGDQQTSRDAERIAASGAPVVQVNTGKGCHLEAEMIHQAFDKLDPAEGSIVMIENVGNLVCPSLFDLGETARVVVISITEGEDKPIKYPDMFRSAQLCLINKIDLLPYLKFDLAALKDFARQVNPTLEFIEVSATSGAGMDQWYAWLEQQFVEHYNIGTVI